MKERADRITPHYFRHFYAIYSRQQGADIFLIQKELGHSDRKTTERYLEKVLQRTRNWANVEGTRFLITVCMELPKCA
ncbi:site-specific integrase [Bacillus megaterium]|nr:site-specific integrase [Priestia megaterium]